MFQNRQQDVAGGSILQGRYFDPVAENSLKVSTVKISQQQTNTLISCRRLYATSLSPFTTETSCRCQRDNSIALRFLY